MHEPASLSIPLSTDLLEDLAQRAAEIVLARIEDSEPTRPSPWLYGAKAAADYLGLSDRAVYHRLDSLPHRRDGKRLVFNVSELDAYLDQLPGMSTPAR